ncbi:MAG: BamA/TamA family outer membrane protein [Sphingobacterium composti]|uniref:translocation and assembly module lipoprotein TamL n=1 Tax=Sphingobacterium composti TaxID=363260 RepID=UPI0013597677|nr:BamA/TamA family outer membrane protein [Sphingobacterium composti Ten et al. 2007 non Yoo et al. 2007]
MNKKSRLFFIASIAFLLLFFESCRSAKYLEEDQALVTKVDLEGFPVHLKEDAYQYISNEIRPNSALNLTIYNIFNTRAGRYKTEKLRSVGEAPRILDTSLVELSAIQIQRFLHTRGYFRAQVTSNITVANKKSKINFEAIPDSVFRIGKITTNFDADYTANVYKKNVEDKSNLKTGISYNVNDFAELRESLYDAMRNEGYYDYLRQYMRIAVDTNRNAETADIEIQVSVPDSTTLKAYRINDVSLKINKYDGTISTSTEVVRDSIYGIDVVDHSSRYKLKPLARYMYLREGDKYSLGNENLSYDRLYEMNGFRSVKINYEKEGDSLLNVNYELTPRSLMSNQIEGEYTFSSGMSGFNIGNTFSHRNIFGGSELLELKLKYGVLFDPRLPGKLSQKVFNNDFQAGVSLVIPRMLLPFGWGNTGRFGLPRTTLSSNIQFFDQDRTYTNSYFINTLNYSWWQTPNLQHSYTPIVVEYRDGQFDAAFRAELEQEGYQLYIASNDRQYFGLGAQYALTYNAKKLQTLDNFQFFRGSFDMSGSTLGLLNNVLNFQKSADGSKTIFGVTYLQYIKGEIDYRLYKHFGGNQQLIFRFNGGAIVPYGNNSSLLIFEKSFYAGGMNGIRAWQARTLGPGNYNRSSIREDLRVNLRNLDQLGEMKLESNLEYRFRILNRFLGAKLNGATFLDMGNVWLLRENELNKGGVFKFDKFFSQIAVGTGFGLRFDMDYFTIRLDAGLKIKDPQFSGKNQWVIQHLFNSKEFKADYFNTHRPDRYSLFQYNFGVGLPF